jgi:hypothetical protein
MSDKINEISEVYLKMIYDIKKMQNDLCPICKNDIEKPYADMDDDHYCHSVTCFDCYCILTTSNYDKDLLVNIIKYLRKRDRIYKQNQKYLQQHEHIKDDAIGIIQ